MVFPTTWRLCVLINEIEEFWSVTSPRNEVNAEKNIMLPDLRTRIAHDIFGERLFNHIGTTATQSVRAQYTLQLSL